MLNEEPTLQAEADELLGALRAGDGEAFTAFVLRHGAAMRRVAQLVTRSPMLADDAVQETWLAVLRGLPRFEARSSLRTWVFRILVNRARSLLARERRVVPFSQLRTEHDGDPLEGRFEHPAAPGHWTVMPLPEWGRSPEDDVLSGEVRNVMLAAIASLPAAQREVITLRDVEGWSAADVCNVCDLSDVHQRVLLHRARTRVRAALERYYERDHR